MGAVRLTPSSEESVDGQPAESTETPFAGLTPDRMLDALDSIGVRGDGRILALNSYENRVYQFYLDEALPGGAGGPPTISVVAKFYRGARWSDEALSEEHAFVLELAERELPVVAPLVINGRTWHRFDGLRFAVYPRRGGHAPELEDADTLRWLGRFVGRIHEIGSARPFTARPALDVRSHGDRSRELVLASGFLPPELVEVYSGVAGQALVGVRRTFERAGDVRTLRLHGDFHVGNILWTDDGPHVVDFDDARMGPAVQDLWMLLSGDSQSMGRQFEWVLEGYESFRRFNSFELHLVEGLRTLRILHHAAWIAQRWNDPAFPAAFTWFNTQRYWQDHILSLREQIALMDEPPLEIAVR
jgi:Ser/Thr protein kinase RdoA (MazF antagonist)